jgi:phosphopantothenoylcysteine synthetase/decarboxylase
LLSKLAIQHEKIKNRNVDNNVVHKNGRQGEKSKDDDDDDDDDNNNNKEEKKVCEETQI